MTGRRAAVLAFASLASLASLASVLACRQPPDRGEPAAARSSGGVTEGSPLFTALAAENFARVDEAFGEPIPASAPNWPTTPGRHAVIPETVAAGGLLIGRFEVTRAQWATFRPETKVESRTENLPIAGVSFEEARAYCHWLTQTTGEPWRLPTEAEHARLIVLAAKTGATGATENTLARWAGGPPSAADAARIVALAEKELMRIDATTSPLLLPVGSCPPALVRPVLLFDLGGNVAEWATVDGDAQSGRAVGGSSLTTDGTDATAPAPPPRAIGLRVVRERAAKPGR